MNKPQKTKLCWNCEGSVSRTVENCPYCGVYLSPEAADIKEEKVSTPSKPPYSPPKQPKKGEIPKAPYAPQEAIVPTISETALPPSASGTLQAVFLPILLLSAGAIGLFFALILFLFASHGTLTLQWNGENWYLYLIGSASLLALGWYALARSD